MSEIEKLYKNAGVEPKYKDYRTKNGKTYEDKNPNNRNIRLLYPPFTAEKQLEIVKMILFSTWWMNLKRLQFSEKFDEGLAQMINELWQDLTEEEKQQVKEILQ